MCVGNSIHFRLPNGYSLESVEVFLDTDNVSTPEGLEPPILGFIPNAQITWATRARYLLSHVFEYWLWW